LEKRHSLSSGELLTRVQLRTHGWEQQLQSYVRLAVFKRLQLKHGGRLAVTCKALASCDEWALAQQFWVPPLRKLKAELEDTVQIKDAAIKEGQRKIKNAGNSKSKLKISRDVAEGTMQGERDALIRQLRQQVLEAEQRAKSAEETSEQLRERIVWLRKPVESEEEPEEESEWLQPEGKLMNLNGFSPQRRPMIAPRFRVELARKKVFDGTAYDKCLYSLVKARQSSGEKVVGMAALDGKSPTSGEWVSMVSVIEAAELAKLDQAWRLYRLRVPCALLPKTEPIRDESFPRLARPSCDGGAYIVTRDSDRLDYERYVLQPVRAWAERDGDPSELRNGDGQLVSNIPSAREGSLSRRQLLRRAGRRCVKEVSVLACVGAHRDCTGLYFGEDGTSDASGRNAVTVMAGGRDFTQPGNLELFTMEENFGMNGGSFDAMALVNAIYIKRLEILSLTDSTPGDLPVVRDYTTAMTDACPTITGRSTGSMQKIEAVSWHC
jgi:hypothetical protein